MKIEKLVAQMKNAALDRIRAGSVKVDRFFPLEIEVKRAAKVLPIEKARELVFYIRAALKSVSSDADSVADCFDRMRESLK